MPRRATSDPPALPTSPLLSPFGLTLFGLAQLADLVTFLAMIGQHGIGAERNPIAVAFVEGHQLGPLIVAKLTVWALAAACAANLQRRNPRLGELVIAFGILAGCLGAVSNVLSR